MINDQLDYKVTIPLLTSDIYNIDARLKEIREIREWVDQLTDWQEGRFMFRYSSGCEIVAWFKEEKDAIVCALRWL